MADTKDPKSPNTTSDAYDNMLSRWSVMETVLGGTEAMRAAGTKYLPRHQMERDSDYQNRLAVSVLRNMTEETLGSLSAKPFTDGMKLSEDLPGEFEPLLEDVDLQGNKLEVFARNWFKQGVAKAFSFLLVDMQMPDPTPDGSPRTVADDAREKLRPYFVQIAPENVIYMRTEMRNGVEVPVHVRIRETYTVRDGFVDVVNPRIRVLEPGRGEFWEPVDAKQKKWRRSLEWKTDIEEIPLVVFYADEEASCCFGKPPLLDQAFLNIAHWQSSSEQRHTLTVARFPILACSGANEEDNEGAPVRVAPNTILYTNDPQGKWYYVEHTGAALEAGQTDLQALEEQMSAYGAEFLKDRPGEETATAKSIDTAAETSRLAGMVIRFEDAVAQALYFMGLWLKKAEGEATGTIQLKKTYGAEVVDATSLTALKDARTTRNISRKVYVEGLRQRGVLPEDYDADEDKEELLDETSDLLALGGTALDLDPTASQLPGAATKPAPPEPAPAAKKVAAKKTAAKKSVK